jgi:SulP family sulfate permease
MRGWELMVLVLVAVSLNEDNIDTNRELTAHGVSNLLAGLVGVAPNYLVYVNTLL